MPELPEVETIRRTLADKLIGQEIAGVELLAPKFIRYPTPDEFCARVTGARIDGLERRGKYLLFELNTGDRMIVHLMMAGRLLYTPADVPLAKHTHVIFTLGNGDHLRYIDLRHFGGLRLLASGEEEGLPPGLRRLGPEPLGESFTPAYLRRVLAGKRGKIKSVLLDQEVIAGLGNIYADEALFLAAIHPERPADSLVPAEVRRLCQAIRQVLTESIEQGGTTFATYVDGEGKRGRFAAMLRVYRRAAEACPRCGSPIERRMVGGRSSHFCPRCQKPGRRPPGRGSPRRRRP